MEQGEEEAPAAPFVHADIGALHDEAFGSRRTRHKPRSPSGWHGAAGVGIIENRRSQRPAVPGRPRGGQL